MLPKAIGQRTLRLIRSELLRALDDVIYAGMSWLIKHVAALQSGTPMCREQPGMARNAFARVKLLEKSVVIDDSVAAHQMCLEFEELCVLMSKCATEKLLAHPVRS